MILLLIGTEVFAMNGAELLADINGSVLSMLSGPTLVATSGNIKTYELPVLVTTNSDSARKTTTSYYVIDEGLNGEVAYYLQKQENYTANSDAASLIFTYLETKVANGDILSYQIGSLKDGKNFSYGRFKVEVSSGVFETVGLGVINGQVVERKSFE